MSVFAATAILLFTAPLRRGSHFFRNPLTVSELLRGLSSLDLTENCVAATTYIDFLLSGFPYLPVVSRFPAWLMTCHTLTSKGQETWPDQGLVPPSLSFCLKPRAMYKPTGCPSLLLSRFLQVSPSSPSTQAAEHNQKSTSRPGSAQNGFSASETLSPVNKEESVVMRKSRKLHRELL